MSMPLEQEAQSKAETLRKKFGDETLMQAHIRAYQAVLTKDIAKCRLWRRVIELLEVSERAKTD